jgi:excisionase family DNA binding protein
MTGDQLTPTVPTLLTVPEACATLRISRWMFYRLVQQRQLDTVKIGSRRLVPASAVTDLLSKLSEQEALR